jgi:hypothetical protein
MARPDMVRYAAKSRSRLSYRDATETNAMAETVTNDRPPVAKPVSRPRSRKPATVSVSALAKHLDVARAYIEKLEAEGVIQRHGGGFLLDYSRIAYIRYLRRERRQSPRAEADAEHVAVKTEMLRLRLMEKKRELVRRDEADALPDEIAGVVLTYLSGWPARIAGHDLVLRRKAESLVRELRTEIANACERRADEVGEPALSEQG